MTRVMHRPQQGKPGINSGSTKNQRWVEVDVDTRSCTTSGKKQGQALLGLITNADKQEELLPPPPPPRTKLKSASAAFIPMSSDAEASLCLAPSIDPTMPVATMPPAPSEGKDCLMAAIQNTLGSELWDLGMMDCQSTGGTYTTIDVVIPALNASHCHLVASQDTEAVAAAQQAQQSQAMQSLLQKFASLSPKVIVAQPPQEGVSQLVVTYCGADRDNLCWDFSHSGSCSRFHTCRWAHAFVETFFINLILQPLTQWCESESAPVQEAEPKQDRWVPSRPAQFVSNDKGSSSTVAGLPLTVMREQSPDRKACELLTDPDDTPWPDYVEPGFGMEKADICKLPMIKVQAKEQSPTALRRRMPSRQNWADIEEDDDEPLFGVA